MRAAVALIASVLAVGTFQTSTPAAPLNPYAHLRPLQKDAAAIIADGIASSATFRSLVNRLDRSDVIVYVDLRPDMRATLGGSLRFLAKSATHRFLRVQVSRADSPLWRVALLGHELQHALEVADASEVSSAADLRALYRRIGVPTGQDSFDSIAARQTGYVVRDELAASHGASKRFARAVLVDPPAAGGESLGDDGAAATPTAMPTRAGDDSSR